MEKLFKDAWSTCFNDRNKNKEESRQRAVIFLSNTCFYVYFTINNLRLCQHITAPVRAARGRRVACLPAVPLAQCALPLTPSSTTRACRSIASPTCSA